MVRILWMGSAHPTAIRASTNSRVFFMPSFCSAPLRPTTQDAQNLVGRCARSTAPVGGYGVQYSGLDPIETRAEMTANDRV